MNLPCKWTTYHHSHRRQNVETYPGAVRVEAHKGACVLHIPQAASTGSQSLLTLELAQLRELVKEVEFLTLTGKHLGEGGAV